MFRKAHWLSWIPLAGLSFLLKRIQLMSWFFAVQLEAEPTEKFKEVMMRQEQQLKLPIILEVGTTHVRLTSVCF